ncbi:MAG: tRNA pseudouridine(38-40) synthase TruA [Endomicrobiia bacterium]
MKFVYRLTIEYNGKNFFGSQRQGSLRTVEKILYSTIKKILKTDFEITLSSRTDRGVHSLGNVVRLRTNQQLNRKTFLSQVNHFLPQDLKVKSVTKVPSGFNPRKDVKYKIYQYKIYNHKIPSVLLKDFVWNVSYDLDFKKMFEAKKILEGTKKFNFATTKEYTELGKSTVCNLKIRLKKVGNIIEIFFVGNRFLNKMVRNLVSLLVEVGRGKILLQDLKNIVKQWQYCKIYPAPANALTLVKILFHK